MYFYVMTELHYLFHFTISSQQCFNIALSIIFFSDVPLLNTLLQAKFDCQQLVFTFRIYESWLLSSMRGFIKCSLQQLVLLSYSFCHFGVTSNYDSQVVVYIRKSFYDHFWHIYCLFCCFTCFFITGSCVCRDFTRYNFLPCAKSSAIISYLI